MKTHKIILTLIAIFTICISCNRTLPPLESLPYASVSLEDTSDYQTPPSWKYELTTNIPYDSLTMEYGGEDGGKTKRRGENYMLIFRLYHEGNQIGFKIAYFNKRYAGTKYWFENLDLTSLVVKEPDTIPKNKATTN